MSKVVKITLERIQKRKSHHIFLTDLPDDVLKKWLEMMSSEIEVPFKNYDSVTGDFKGHQWNLGSLVCEEWTVPEITIGKNVSDMDVAINELCVFGDQKKYLQKNECEFDKEIKEWMEEQNEK